MEDIFETQSELQEEQTDTQTTENVVELTDELAENWESANNPSADTENSTQSEEKSDEKADTKPFAFNPLQMAIRPFYMQAMAEDELFAREVREKEARAERPKSLAECCEYIMGEAYAYAKEHKQGNFGLAGCDDAQIVEMIKHYYDEDDIKIRKIGAGARAEIKTTATPKTDTKKKADTKKPKAKERAKETLENTRIPMTRPKTTREAKKVSREQAKQVDVMDIFAGMWDEEAEVVGDMPE
jgi:hypothetical protein